MRHFAFVLFILAMLSAPCTASTLTEEKARATIEKLNDVVSMGIINPLVFRNNPGTIYIWSKRTGWDFFHRGARFIFAISTHVGRPIPHLSLYISSEKPLDVTTLKITNAGQEKRRGRVKGGLVEFRVPSNGIVRYGKYRFFAGHVGYNQVVSLKASINEELDKLANLAKLCEREEDVIVELKGPIASGTITLSETEKLAIVDMWNYFAAYAFLAETYHEPPEIANIGRYTDEGYDERFLDILEEFGLKPPQREEREEEESTNEIPEKNENNSHGNFSERQANLVEQKHDARPMAVTEVPLAANGTATDDSFQQRKLMAEQNRLAEESKTIQAEQEMIEAEIQTALQERERQLEAERARLIEEQNRILAEQVKAEAERKAALEEAERKKIAEQEKAKAEAQKAAEEAAQEEERKKKEREQNIKDNSHLIDQYIDLYWGQ